MRHLSRRKVQYLALGATMLVTQCCCCIWPIRFQVQDTAPPPSAVESVGHARGLQDQEAARQGTLAAPVAFIK